MTQGERVREIRKKFNLTLEKFGEKLGVGKSTISDIENNRRSLTEHMTKSICREFNVNENWLRTGEGDMPISADRHSEISNFMNQLLHEDNASFKNRLISVLADLNVEEWEFLEHRLKQLYEGTKIRDDTIPSEVHNQTTEKLEDAYKKSVLKPAQKTDGSTASNTTDVGKNEKAVG